MRWILRIGYGSILFVLALGAIALYQGVTTSIRAENTLHATLLVVDLTKQYVTTNDGAWPDSWDDLEKVSPPESSAGTYDWPADSAKIQQCVEVDFDADPKRIALQAPEEFDAVLPIGPYYPYQDYGSVRALIEAVAAHHEGESTP
ncbi:hypothetical protein [Aeoliella sp.]|uniref:hypothetical protein n=1 Tax=Aeoliella sp. TaxID=2795800 RepID=UPI003CCC0DEB